MEKVSDERLRRFAERIMSRQPGYDEAASMATELNMLREVVAGLHESDYICATARDALIAYDSTFPVPAPPADPTPEQRAYSLCHEHGQIGMTALLNGIIAQIDEAANLAYERGKSDASS
jgi:hypothetical protein